ncbi:MAG: sigma-54-dependent Fis family transcriptional regulator [Gemmatimonadetes bacterium]|nr:sigma-54-dependent Fis family transcriptional regulator [Gemmatimonadota bacterium]
MTAVRVLVVDDEAGIRFGIRDFLESKGFEVDEADTCGAAIEVLRGKRPDVVILDYLLPDGNALELLPKVQEIHHGLPLVVLTAHGSIDLAVRAIKEGADQFLTKPVELPALQMVLERLVENQRNRQRQLARESRQAREAHDPFAGSSAAMRDLAAQARRVVASDSPILIVGETGAGKGVLARWLHANSPRGAEAFVDLNCAGISRDLLDSELFGHEKGAFTGAVSAKTGLFDVAHRGTLFLDEIGDMDLQVQAKLLKVLEEQRFRRVGDVRDRRVDVRLVAATHQDLARFVRENRFRRDLYFRVNTLPLAVPPLRERVEDIPVLARELLTRLAADLGRGEVTLLPDAERALAQYSWPGNVRELKNVLERALLLSDGRALGRRDLRFEAGVTADPLAETANLTLEELERRHIELVLREERGRVETAAKRLGIPRSSLYQKLKQYGITASSFQTDDPKSGAAT